MQYPHLKFGAGSESLTRTFDLASRRSVVELYPHGAGEANRTPIFCLEGSNNNHYTTPTNILMVRYSPSNSLQHYLFLAVMFHREGVTT